MLNSKSEYNRCAIPRLTSKLGEHQYRRWEEKRKEEILEIKIRKLKKKRNRRRRDEDDRDKTVPENEEQNCPTRKRRKVGGQSKEQQEEREKGQQDIRELMKKKEIEKDQTERSEEILLPDGWKQQGGAEALLHPEGRECPGPTPIGVARPGPTLLGEDKLLHPEGIDCDGSTTGPKPLL